MTGRASYLCWKLSPGILCDEESNLERSEIETLRTAKVSVDVAMYSFTDRELSGELVRLARSDEGSRVVL